MMHVTAVRVQVWMRTASTPAFRKLWGRLDTSLKAGTQVNITIDNRWAPCAGRRHST